MAGRTLDYVALAILLFVVITIVYAIIYIHDIPYEMAKKRNHPHQDAIHTAGWVSLFLMHAIWPLLWIWATLYKPGYGWGLTNMAGTADGKPVVPTGKEPVELAKRIAELEKREQQQQKAYAGQLQAMADRIDQLEEKIQQRKEA